MDIGEKSINLHRKLKGKIEIRSKVKLNTRNALSLAYTPGVGAVSTAISKNENQVWELTNRGNSVAIVSDGTAVLGLGNIGPQAALPVMEGKAAIFKEFAGIDAWPLCIDTVVADEIVKFCLDIAPSFGGINLEDISAPRCFEILERLQQKSPIAVFHDDQDGTAIAILAALINACRATKKVLGGLRVVINGAGAAGIATARLLLVRGVKDLILIDSAGAIYAGRPGLNPFKRELAAKTNRSKVKGRLEEALVKADVFIGLSKAGLLKAALVKTMNPQPIIFALANPVPEIMPDEAIRSGAAVVGTGRSDFPNQINNALVFPGIFRGLLDGWKKTVTVRMKLAAAQAVADTVKKPACLKILPDIKDKKVVEAVSRAVAQG
ncbi:MAG: NADP-dependent malic enzyme [Planctomycetes bacterium]|jgi:malate dehydrogenase (oxaloacetate-decarboxylating)|nr:NADP-dependent malic enzyme [Planctomycetota bacterium]